MTVRMVQWQPYCVTKAFDPKTPVCAACKRTNRTRSFCRERHKHRQLPWCSVYVLLSTLDTADPSTVVAGSSRKVGDEETNGEGKDDSPSGDSKAKAEDASAAGSDTIASDAGDPGDDINEIAQSRTFLAKVSCRSTSIHWLEMAEYDSSEAAPFPGAVGGDVQAYNAGMANHAGMAQMPPHAIDPNQPVPPQYYPPNMNYQAQQHQNALKSRQQYYFQMQQQHQHYPPPGPPGAQQSHWQQAPYPMGPSGQGEVNPAGVTAGEAAAAQQRRGHPGSPDDGQQQQFQHPQQHWAAMYYQQPPGVHYAPPPHDGNGQAAMQGGIDPIVPGEGQDHEHYHTPPESANGDAEEGPDEKRQRV